jgi:hypothetical protein
MPSGTKKIFIMLASAGIFYANFNKCIFDINKTKPNKPYNKPLKPKQKL